LAKHTSDPDLRSKHQHASLAALEHSVHDGLIDAFAIRSEVDLTPIHDNPGYIAILEQLKAK
jgi:hypothetical protein